jgi:hypothetical protein
MEVSIVWLSTVPQARKSIFRPGLSLIRAVVGRHGLPTSVVTGLERCAQPLRDLDHSERCSRRHVAFTFRDRRQASRLTLDSGDEEGYSRHQRGGTQEG